MREQSAYERVFLGIAITVTVVWAIATIVQVVSPTRQVPTYANVVMMVVATSFFGGAVVAGRRSQNGKPVSKSRSSPKKLMNEAIERAKQEEKQ